MILKFEDFLILEKSSLSSLGVPTEVLKEIQKEFAIPQDARWERVIRKSDVERILRQSRKKLILQIAIDSIKVFVTDRDQYFIDRFILNDEGDWSGAYKKLKREYLSKNQLMVEVEPRANIYLLRNDFSLQQQGQRKVEKQDKNFKEFTQNFKRDFLINFRNILKRIVGQNYKNAQGEILKKARQIELENNMIISGLENPLEGPNGLTILDEFLYKFEDALTEFFGERLDIYEISEYFGRDKVMTMFMYYVYTGKIMKN
jgi:hypothetical protein